MITRRNQKFAPQNIVISAQRRFFYEKDGITVDTSVIYTVPQGFTYLFNYLNIDRAESNDMEINIYNSAGNIIYSYLQPWLVASAGVGNALIQPILLEAGDYIECYYSSAALIFGVRWSFIGTEQFKTYTYIGDILSK